MTPDVRPASLDDLEALVSFNASMALETEGKTLDMELLRQGTRAVFDSYQRGFYLVAEVDGSPVGSLLVTYEWSDWRNGRFWWIQSVYVRPERRRMGVYSAMHRWIIDTARAKPDVCGVRLYVDRNNAAARETYRSLGMGESPLRHVRGRLRLSRPRLASRVGNAAPAPL